MHNVDFSLSKASAAPDIEVDTTATEATGNQSKADEAPWPGFVMPDYEPDYGRITSGSAPTPEAQYAFDAWIESDGVPVHGIPKLRLTRPDD
jgi:hypothetical protein